MNPIRSIVTNVTARMELDESERASAATLLTLLAHGERVAMRGAARQAGIAMDGKARRFLRAQARHEAFHARVFDAAGRWIAPDVPPEVAVPRELAALEQRMALACDRRDFAASLLIQQVFLEGLGHVVLHRLNGKLAADGDALALLRELILRQEAAHHRFGVTMLAGCIDREPGVAARLLPMGRELFEIVTLLLARLDETLDHLDPGRPDYVFRLRDTLPDWLEEAIA